jgi:energy-coupling factor transport system substrate-specific component
MSPMAVFTSWYTPLDKQKLCLTVRDTVLFGVLGALTFALKFAMAGLPNIEPVSLMVILFAVCFSWKALYPVYLYVALEILVYGLGQWNLCYLYVWTVLAVVAILFRKMEHPLGWALLSAVFGLLFGALCGIVDIFIGGFGYAAAKWVSGIPFDLLHCGGNFVITLLLFRPLGTLLKKLYNKNR